jgi:PAS domain S-box-containing protein
MRLFAAIFSLILLALGVFFAYEYYSGKASLIANDGEYAKHISTQLIQFFLILAVLSSLLFSLLLYSVLTTRVAARKIAYNISKDIAFSKEQFRRFYDLSPVPYLLIDSKGIITRPNKASLRFFRKTEEELLQTDLFSFFIDPEDPKGVSQYKEKANRHIAIEQVELQVKFENEEVRWVLLSIEDITSPGWGQHNGLVTLVDIHEQKELERIKTEFLSLASHQLRSPLSNLKWYIDFLLTRRSKQMTEEVQGYLHKMYRRNADMAELVNTLLNLSRIEMGRIKIEKETADITEIAKSVVEELESEATEKKIALETAYSGDTVMETDRKLVRIILQNLLSNAFRYTLEGGSVQLRILASSSKVRMEVEDTGVGIPPDEQNNIFSKLYRATNAKKIEANGNGIGLYMCKELVENMGGEISFMSKEGEGTTFFVDLIR